LDVVAQALEEETERLLVARGRERQGVFVVHALHALGHLLGDELDQIDEGRVGLGAVGDYVDMVMHERTQASLGLIPHLDERSLELTSEQSQQFAPAWPYLGSVVAHAEYAHEAARHV
jgi:hypothetical protein